MGTMSEMVQKVHEPREEFFMPRSLLLAKSLVDAGVGREKPHDVYLSDCKKAIAKRLPESTIDMGISRVGDVYLSEGDGHVTYHQRDMSFCPDGENRDHWCIPPIECVELARPIKIIAQKPVSTRTWIMRDDRTIYTGCGDLCDMSNGMHQETYPTIAKARLAWKKAHKDALEANQIVADTQGENT